MLVWRAKAVEGMQLPLARPVSEKANREFVFLWGNDVEVLARLFAKSASENLVAFHTYLKARGAAQGAGAI